MPAFSPPPEVAQIADTLESRGFQAWAVGGAIRDELLGQPREDWDLATDAPPPDVRRIFRRTVPIGIEHGTVGVLSPTGAMFEVTTFRRDIETDGRHAVIEFATTIQEDLARRDFTINAMGWRPATDEFVDPWGGKADLEDGVLKAVGDPRQRVAEDYLRVLRGLRFAGRLDLEIESATREALEAGVRGSATLSAERVREELGKVLRGQQPSAALRLYGEFGVLEIWYAEIAASRQHPHWELNLAAVDAISARRPLLRLVRWLLAPGSVDEAADPALASEAEGEARASVGCRALGRLRFSNADTQYVAQLLRHYRPLVSPMDSSARIRGWLSEVGVEKARDLFRLHIADARAANAGETLRYLCHAWRRVHDEILAGHPLRISDLAIGGDELLALGVRRGPAVGLLLDELLARVLEDPELNRVGELRELARELIEISSLASGREEGGPESMGG